MKSIFLTILLCLLGRAMAFASPAYPRPHQLTLSDGSRLTIVGHGDECCHYVTTLDGYTIVRQSDGFFYYADVAGDRLTATACRASDAGLRSSQELDFLEGRRKYLAPDLTPCAQTLRQCQQMLFNRPCMPFQLQRAPSPINGATPYRGLVILVNFNDRKFSRGDDEAHSYFDDLMNKDGFTLYDDRIYGPQSYTGSVRDYFSDNSYGRFIPEFDVVGPVEIDESQYFIDGVNRTFELVEKVLEKVDDKVDFSRYDADGDGEVDMVYLVYAGYASSYQGNDERLIWPHAGSMYDSDDESSCIYYDGKRMGRFACSAEIFGWEQENERMLDGLGVIVHEFSHVLGFADHYDTSNGYQEHPNAWDVMAAGNYNGTYNRTPAGYNSYEKAVAGFIAPLDITDFDAEKVTLCSTGTTADACLLRSVQEHVSFYMENRQPEKWDLALPGHGMLVWRVDSIRPEYWEQNMVNVTTRACFRLVRACGTQGSFFTGVVDTDFDAFPGTHGITELNNDLNDANLLSYDRYACPAVLSGISETSVDSAPAVISFTVNQDSLTDNCPVNYDLAQKFIGEADCQIFGEDGTEEWQHVVWEGRSGTVTTAGGDEQSVIYGLFPHVADIIPEGCDMRVRFQYTGDGRTFKVEAQRLALDTEYGIWLANLTDVDNLGAGTMNFRTDRHGIPSLANPETEIGFCAMQPNAILVSQKKLIRRLVIFRNVVFREYSGSETGIHQPAVFCGPHTNRNIIYNLHGQPCEEGRNGLSIFNGRKYLKIN